ncbi:MAG: hypothetical protein HYX50_02440 [Chloroflexi bacterium]|nr:hypothetical protein [Chloroflexota bacterium]
MRYMTATQMPAIAPSSAPTPVGTYPATLVDGGRPLTGGLAMIRGNGRNWIATLTKLDRPGVVAALYFGEGRREVTLCLADGRSARARLTGTTFIAASERVCDLRGLEPFA